MLGDLRDGDSAEKQIVLNRIAEMPAPDLAMNARDIFPAVLAAKDFKLVESLAINAITARSFDVGVVDAAQCARVKAFLNDGDFNSAAREGAAYYNFCPLNKTAEAISFLCQALEKAGNSSLSEQFKKLQARDALSDIGGEAQTTAELADSSIDRLQAIRGDLTQFDSAHSGRMRSYLVWAGS